MRRRISAQAMSRSLRVSEVFESLQGEGPFCCRRALFVRLAGCNLRCPFCDTKYSLDPRSGRKLGIGGLVDRVAAGGYGLVVFTGGEPLLQRSALNAAVEALQVLEEPPLVQIETNGTLPPPEPREPLYSAYFVVSPKDVPVRVPGARTRPEWPGFARETRRAFFKFLVAGEDDVDAVEGWVEAHSVPRRLVYLMPLTREGMGAEALLEAHRRVARLALARGFNFSPRMHLLLGLA